ncbi:hypothetical protein [Bradyrhizobium sp. CCGUVB23]|uniref:hypothetical protein n=2 Tax=unclassified Bradyrhizobium TaxID=2631580 RepID=UPI0020B453DF|nr:hypothetical protein [Bradyrhizobium sp. CCGUVB23]MCP3468026.1 hypothetical protein [Bradyrhizobium sp. CCGUVB23]
MNDTLHAEAERLLTAAKIWKLGNFGWLNAYDADPDLFGHAQWQTDPPIDNPMIFNARGTHKAAQPEPPEWLKTIAIAGADFEGLMEAARMSMGLLLLSIDAARGRHFVNDPFFDLHRMSALIYLATASERLRELFIAAAFRRGQEDYNRSKGTVHGEPRRKFSSPFIEAADKFTNNGCLSKLIALAPDIVEMRDERNTLVHEIATEIAQRERQSHAEQSGPPAPTIENFQKLQSIQASFRERFARERETVIKNLSDRYSLLVRVSNEIFEFEHHVRRRP